MSKKTSKAPVPLETVSPTGKQEVEQHVSQQVMGTSKATKLKQSKATDKPTADDENPKHPDTKVP